MRDHNEDSLVVIAAAVRRGRRHGRARRRRGGVSEIAVHVAGRARARPLPTANALGRRRGSRPTAPSFARRARRPGPRRHGNHHAPPRSWRASAWSSPRWATRAPTCCIRASCSSSRATTASWPTSSKPASSPPKRRARTRSARSSRARWAATRIMQPDLYEINVETGDRLLLCSDGLSTMVHDDGHRSRSWRARATRRRCASQLVNAAIAAGGHDNVTVIVADVTGYAEVRRKKMARKTQAVPSRSCWCCWPPSSAARPTRSRTGRHHAAYLAEQDGKVAIYRGVPGSVLGMTFSHLEATTDVNRGRSAARPGQPPARRRHHRRQRGGGRGAGGIVPARHRAVAGRKRRRSGRRATDGGASAAQHVTAMRTVRMRRSAGGSTGGGTLRRRARGCVRMTRRNIELILLCVAAPLVVLLFAMLAHQRRPGADRRTPSGCRWAFSWRSCVAHLSPCASSRPAPTRPSCPSRSRFRASASRSSRAWLPTWPCARSCGCSWAWCCMVVVLALLRNLDRLANYKYTLMIAGFVLLLSPMLPVVGHGDLRQPHLARHSGRLLLPARRAREDLSSCCSWPATWRRTARCSRVFTWRVGPFRLPDIRTLLPLLAHVGSWPWSSSCSRRTWAARSCCSSLFLVMLYVATGKKFYLVIGLRPGRRGRRGAVLHASATCRTRVEHLARPLRRRARTPATSSCRRIYSIADGGLFGVGIGRGMAARHPRTWKATSSSPPSPRRRGFWARAAVLLLYLCFAMRGFVTAARAKSDVSSFIAVGLTATIVLQAFIIVGGVTQAHPADRHHAALHQPGRLFASGQLHHRGHSCLRCGDEGTGAWAAGLCQRPRTIVQRRTACWDACRLGKRLTGTMIVLRRHVRRCWWPTSPASWSCKAERLPEACPATTTPWRDEAETERGTISTYDGVVLAQSVQERRRHLHARVPSGRPGQPRGGLRLAAVRNLAASRPPTTTRSRASRTSPAGPTSINVAGGRRARPATTSRSRINSTDSAGGQARSGGRRRAPAWCMDPNTGAVLAHGQRPPPTTPPTSSSCFNAGGSSSTELSGRCINRATQALYAPGSTFKMVTLAAALRRRRRHATNTVYDAPASHGNRQRRGHQRRQHRTTATITPAPAPPRFPPTPYSARWACSWAPNAWWSGAENFGFNMDSRLRFCRLPPRSCPIPTEMTDVGNRLGGCRRAGRRSTHSPAGPQATVLRNGHWWAAPSPTTAPSCSPTWWTASTTPTASAASPDSPPKLMQAVDAGHGGARAEGAGGRRGQRHRHRSRHRGRDRGGQDRHRRTRRRRRPTAGSWASPPPRTHAWWLPSPSRRAIRARAARQGSKCVENRP